MRLYRPPNLAHKASLPTACSPEMSLPTVCQGASMYNVTGLERPNRVQESARRRLCRLPKSRERRFYKQSARLRLCRPPNLAHKASLPTACLDHQSARRLYRLPSPSTTSGALLQFTRPLIRNLCENPHSSYNPRHHASLGQPPAYSSALVESSKKHIKGNTSRRE